MKEGKRPGICNSLDPLAILLTMSIRKCAGEWEPLLLGIEPEHCGVCNLGLYRNTTMLKGGWQRCSVCNRFVHYACLVSGKVHFLKRRPRVCRNCEHTVSPPHPSPLPPGEREK